ncbi:galactose-1-epimerase [Budviciaceae bacterium BWR-B9]|uniref:Aldose 1-epimerase n=1 Tax=Limnobaculum allomyrinae TaxID=2791986 RepID=A0ABS1IMJ1_9GAMM|nr:MULTISPECIES: galactose-1-epimerase [Limnobaculum]MBK5142767.1 galactose-1-epimerase [Limnobaculum allomyrinae]MBV7690346.1 galactose-1-epimerase [Limnobaculum sp. M2-1]
MLETTAALAPDAQPFHIVTLTNQSGSQAQMMDWGAIWLSFRLPMGDGSVRELLLGCSKPEDYLHQGAYLGATVGRYANRIAHSRLIRQAIQTALAANQGDHQLHGGANSFDQRRWTIESQCDQSVTFKIYSADGDNGYPGNFSAEVTYTLTETNRIEISYLATVDRDCPVNLTNHAYFNLDGKNQDSRHHRLQINANNFLPVNSEGIPDADLTQVNGLSMDFRQPKTLMQDFLADEYQRKVSGYDHAYLLSPECHSGEQPAALLWSADNKVKMSVFTTKPALQLYSGNFLQGTPSRDGKTYGSFAGIALESEFLPDSPNHPEWPQPDCWLTPEQTYRSSTVYQFDLA